MTIVDRICHNFPAITQDAVTSRLRYCSYVNWERRYMYYEVPKAGCTTIKTLIHGWEDLPPIPPLTGELRELKRDMFVHDRGQFRMQSLLDLTEEQQDEVLNDESFFKFTFVRNPYTRALSAWRDKARQCAPGYEAFYTTTRGSLPDEGTNLYEFDEFVGFLAAQNLDDCDHHWLRQTAQLFHPVIPFSFVGRTENFLAGIREVAKTIGFSVVSKAANQSTVGSRDVYDEDSAAAIYRLYEQDFQTFQYDGSSWVPYFNRSGPNKSAEAIEREIIERNVVIGLLYDSRAKALQDAKAVQEVDAKAVQEVNVQEHVAPSDFPHHDFDDLFERYIDPVQGWLALNEARLLFETARSVPDGCIVEVGSYRGRSATALALGSLFGSRVPIFAVDPHDSFEGISGGRFGSTDRGHFMKNLIGSALFHLVKPLAVSSEFLSRHWPTPVHLLWIDGDHRYESVSRDVNHWREQLVPGARLLLNDSTDPEGGPGRLARELAACGEFHPEGTVGKITVLRYSGPTSL